MKYLLFLCIFCILTLQANSTVDKAKKIVAKSIENKDYKNFYKAIELLEPQADSSIDILYYNIIIELFINDMDKHDMSMDYISVCNMLKQIHKKQEVVFPEIIKGIINSKKLEAYICKVAINSSGEELFGNVKIFL